MDTIWALMLIGLALFVGGLLFRRVPGAVLGIGAVLVVFGLGIPALVIDENRSDTAAGAGASEEASGGGGTDEAAAPSEASGGGGAGGASASAEGKLIFTQSCGTCHTLKDAGTSGQIGPPLDTLKPDEKRVLAAIKNGGSGSGTMPANIVTGKEATAVAKYVASVAGK